MVCDQYLQQDDETTEGQVRGDRCGSSDHSELLDARVSDSLRSECGESDTERDPYIGCLLDETHCAEDQDERGCGRRSENRRLVPGNARQFAPAQPMAPLDALGEVAQRQRHHLRGHAP